MLSTFSTLAVAAALGGGGTAAAVAAPQIQAPRAPSVTVPKPPHPDLRPVGCTATTCTPENPTEMAGTVVSFTGSQLTERTGSGHTYTALVDDKTNVACPTQQAIDDGQVFNPPPPSIAQIKIGSGVPSVAAKPRMTDKYACSATNITAGRHIAGAERGRDSSGQLRWIAVALAPH